MTAAIDLLIEIDQPSSAETNLPGGDASRPEVTA